VRLADCGDGDCVREAGDRQTGAQLEAPDPCGRKPTRPSAPHVVAARLGLSCMRRIWPVDAIDRLPARDEGWSLLAMRSARWPTNSA
jgi:hypothetical protein